MRCQIILQYWFNRLFKPRDLCSCFGRVILPSLRIIIIIIIIIISYIDKWYEYRSRNWEVAGLTLSKLKTYCTLRSTQPPTPGGAESICAFIILILFYNTQNRIVSSWPLLRSHMLQLNTAKTEVIWLTTGRRMHQLPQQPLRVSSDLITPVLVVRDLGIYLEKSWRWCFNEIPRHANHVCLFYGITSASGHLPLDN